MSTDTNGHNHTCDKLFQLLAVNVVFVLRAAAEVECGLFDVARCPTVVQKAAERRKASSYAPTFSRGCKFSTQRTFAMAMAVHPLTWADEDAGRWQQCFRAGSW